MKTKRGFFWDSLHILTRDGPVKVGNVTFSVKNARIVADLPESQWNRSAMRKDLRKLRGEK